ncbi:MAG: response regulator [Candidatus Microsaccharimonas sp.]
MTKVVLIEDDTWLAETEAATLAKAGFDVTMAPHAPAAIELIDTVHPDVLVMDVLLPGATAFALLNELQSHDDTRGIPVVLCTNLAEQFNSTALAQYGVRRIVNKTTMHPDDLIAAVKAVVA